MKGALSAVENSLQGHAYDDAAARLLKMRVGGAKFTAQDAAAYRRAMADSYSQALEAASRGDAKAQAAVQMIRAAGPH